MYTINGLKISIPRGDTADLLFKLTNANTEQPYLLGEGQKLRFDVFYKSNSRYVIQVNADSTAQESDGTVTVRLTSENTDIERSEYRYVLRITDTASGDVDTILGTNEELTIEIL